MSFVSENDLPEAEFVPTQRGAGVVCGHVDCEGKFLVNAAKLKELPGRRTNSRTLICPYCERRSMTPKEYQ